MKSKKVITGVLLTVVVITVLFLTFQKPEDTMRISESVREQISKLGYHRSPREFRSDVHIVEYFIVGLAAILFGKAMKWKNWLAPFGASLFGFLDETVKIFLPTREFGVIDLLKDFFGIILSLFLVLLINRIMASRDLYGLERGKYE